MLILLDSFAKLRKVTISFFMSVRPHGTTHFPLGGFYKMRFSIFRKYIENTEVSLKSDENNGYFTHGNILPKFS